MLLHERLTLDVRNNALGNEESMALLRFHAFTGCELTGRFSGFSKTT